MRIACVYVPELALQAILRRDPERRGDPVALCESPGERARVIACTGSARQAGVRPGLTASQARAVASGFLGADRLRVVVAQPADTEAAAAALADLGYAFAPQVEASKERLYLEVGELTQLYPEGERAVAQAIASQAARLGLEVQIGIASSKTIARVAAQTGEFGIVTAGQERAHLANVPIAAALAAGLPANVAGDKGAATAVLGETFVRWGIPTLGALARLSAQEVALRVGRVGNFLHALASGNADEPFAPQLPPDALEEGMDIDYPVAELEPLAFLLRGLFDRALRRLTCRGLACAGLGLRFKLDPRGFDVRDIGLAAPTRDPGTLLELVRLDLARRPPDAPIVGIAALLLPARVRAAQLDLFRPAGPTPEKMAATLARISSLVGPENVGVPAVVDTYKEEVVGVRPFPVTEASRAAAVPAPEQLSLGFRRFRPPRPLEVLMDRDGPVALRGQEVVARVLIAAGPYRSSGAWWTEEGFSRDYWDVHASDGAVYRMHQDRAEGTWFLDGYYD
ncbi:MAG TPA: DNA polymerase Y family protein [Polyangia bacterium]